MADKPNGLTTEQLLIELGRVVMGLGTKIDSLGQKLDAIHEVLSRETAETGGEVPEPFSMEPLLSKLDSIHQALSAGPPAASGEGGEVVMAQPSLDLQPLLEKLEELKETVKSAAPVVHAGTGGDALPAGLDLTPVMEKFDEMKTAVEKLGMPDEIKSAIEGLASSVEKMPEKLMEGMDKKIDTLTGKLEKIQKAAEDRKFVETITGSVDKVREGVETSGSDVVKALNQIPVKLDGMGEEIAGSIGTLQEKTGEVLEKADESLEKTEKTLERVKDELQKGLKLNTDMTGQMVEITSSFADKVKEDQVSDMNDRAVEHFNNREYQEADKLLKEALKIAPNNPELLCNSANVLAAQEDLKGAEKLFRKALEEAPDLEPAISGLGLIMVRTDRAEETIEFLKSTILSGEPSIRTTIAYSRALAALDRHSEAVELLETCLRGAPDNPDVAGELAKYGHGEKD